MMCSRSGGLMLSQNRRGWLKWSSNDSGASRTLVASGIRTGVST